jgi:SOS-response transcriptional repressor LexA
MTQAMINELDLVALKRPLPDHRLEPGAVGTVVMVHDGGYTLEFVACDGDTVAIVPCQPTMCAHCVPANSPMRVS